MPTNNSNNKQKSSNPNKNNSVKEKKPLTSNSTPNNKTRNSEFISKVKYLNNLPSVPFDPKFLVYPFDK